MSIITLSQNESSMHISWDPKCPIFNLNRKSKNEKNDKEKKRNCTDMDDLAVEFSRLNFDFDKWHTLAEMVKNGDIYKKYEATKSMRLMLSMNSVDIPIQSVIDVGAVPFFVSFLSKNSDFLCNTNIHDELSNNFIKNNKNSNNYFQNIYENLMFEAAWALTNIASGTSEQTEAVVQHGGIDKLLNLLMHDREDIREQGMWGLGNVAGDRFQFRDIILNTPNSLQYFINAIEKSCKISSVRTGVWALSNFCRGHPRPCFESIIYLFDFLKSTILNCTDSEILSDALWAMDSLAENEKGIKILAQHFNLVKRIVSLLDHEEIMVKRPALRITGQLVSGSAKETQCAIDSGAIPLLLKLLTTYPAHRKSIRKDSCWAISNIAAGSSEQLNTLLEFNTFEILLGIFKYDDEVEVKKEAAWGICNAFCNEMCDKKHLHKLLELDIIKPVCDMLNINDKKVLCVVLDALNNILKLGEEKALKLDLYENPYIAMIKECDGFVTLNLLLQYPDYTVYCKSSQILTNFGQYRY